MTPEQQFTAGRYAVLAVAVALLVPLGHHALEQERLIDEHAAAGSKPRPVLAAAKDVPADTVLTRELLTERPLPEALVRPSVVQPVDLEKVLGQRTRFELSRHDTLLWSALELDAAAYFARQELPVGAAFAVGDFERRAVATEQLTPWSVRDEHLPQLEGTKLVKVVKAGAQLRISDLSPVRPVTP